MTRPDSLPPPPLRLGCAGWSLSRPAVAAFPAAGSHLERYAARLPAVEVNSSFYRHHREPTWQRWAATVPAGFRFAVKVWREITHVTCLGDPGLLDDFLRGPRHLGAKLGPLLVQLPPSLAYDAPRAERFFAALRQRHAGTVVCEPRHPTWFDAPATDLLVRHAVARVAADPAVVPAAADPGAWDGVAYYRLHGSPRTYWSSYDDPYLAGLARRLAASVRHRETWCIFDNTAAGAALVNALDLAARLASDGSALESER